MILASFGTCDEAVVLRGGRMVEAPVERLLTRPHCAVEPSLMLHST